MKKPNIVLITTDTQRCDTLAFMGHPHAISPHLDRLAAEGVWFDNAHTVAPVCSPARCSLLTGVHAPVHGCVENGIGRREDLPVFPDLLRQQGYYNIMVGKTHFGPVPESFDVLIQTGGKKENIDDAYGTYISQLGYSRATSVPNPTPEAYCLDTFIVDQTIHEIGKAVEQEQGRPFFAYCSLVSPHNPFDPPGSWANAYDGIPLPEINYTSGEIASLPNHLRQLLGLYGENAERLHERLSTDAGREEIDRLRRLYYGLTAYCDAQIGRLIDYLNDHGLRERTLVIFSSDHGTQLFDHGFDDKHNYYDASWRVPLIMSMPGTLPSGHKESFAVWHDITATILGAAGTSCNTMHGFDLFTPLVQGLPLPRTCAAATLYKSAALATARWKLEYYFAEGRGRLFDRLADPLENHDLFDDPVYVQPRDGLVSALLDWYCGLTDLHHRKTHTKNSLGHVSKRVAMDVASEDALHNEQRLNERAACMDPFVAS
jgi:arylsulfatase A-like enzyme